MLGAVAAGMTMATSTVYPSILITTRQAYGQMKAEEPEIDIVRDSGVAYEMLIDERTTNKGT